MAMIQCSRCEYFVEVDADNGIWAFGEHSVIYLCETCKIDLQVDEHMTDEEIIGEWRHECSESRRFQRVAAGVE